MPPRHNLTGDALIGLRPDAFLVLTGSDFAVDFATDGSRTVTLGTGTVENVCQTLGD